MHALFKMIQTDAKLLLRTPMVIFVTLLVPLPILYTAGSTSGNSPLPQYGGLTALEIAVPGLAALIISLSGIFDLPLAMITRRQQGILRRYRATPVPAWVVLASQAVLYLALNAAGVLLLLVIGKAAFNLALPQNPLGLVLAIAAASASFLSIGFLLSGLLPNVTTIRGVGMGLFVVMLFLNSSVNPGVASSPILRVLSGLSPLTYAARLMNSAWFGPNLDLTSLAILAGVLVVCGSLSNRFFRWE